ncbi:unnamed protein product [Rotaria sp. Silwood1]|nr:unnamed protein product [Rotaria sp. Silwood1]CAF1278218.1 unnamed protein product [Rotaria sp. Silwood1]
MCKSAKECCSGTCHEKCITPCKPVNAACNKSNNVCCNGLQCDQSTKKCCRLAGYTTLTPSECCSLQWIPNANGCGGICSSSCQPVNAACDDRNDVCCNGLECNQSNKKCCRLAGFTALTPSECCSLQWIPNTNDCGGICGPPCKPVNITCDQSNDVCCNGLECG